MGVGYSSEDVSVPPEEQTKLKPAAKAIIDQLFDRESDEPIKLDKSWDAKFKPDSVIGAGAFGVVVSGYYQDETYTEPVYCVVKFGLYDGMNYECRVLTRKFMASDLEKDVPEWADELGLTDTPPIMMCYRALRNTLLDDVVIEEEDIKDGVCAIAMPMYGQSLGSIYESRKELGLPSLTILRVMIQLVSQLEIYHKKLGHLHGDIKQDNIVLCGDRKVVLIDVAGDGFTDLYACPESAGLFDNESTIRDSNPRCDIEALMLMAIDLVTPNEGFQPVLRELFDELKESTDGAKGKRRIKRALEKLKDLKDDFASASPVAALTNREMSKISKALKDMYKICFGTLPDGYEPLSIGGINGNVNNYTMHDDVYQELRDCLAKHIMDQYKRYAAGATMTAAKVMSTEFDLKHGKDSMDFPLLVGAGSGN